MKSFTYTCLDISEVCEHNRLDLGNVMDAICNSDVSFGTNYDTLITSEDLDSILYDAEIVHDGLDYDEHDMDERILISLGS